MILRGRVENGVVVFQSKDRPPDGTLVEVTPVRVEIEDARRPAPVSQEQREALLGLIGIRRVENPPEDEEVERIIEEARMKKYG